MPRARTMPGMNQMTRVQDVRPAPLRQRTEPVASHSADRSMLVLQYVLAVAAAVSAVLLSQAR